MMDKNFGPETVFHIRVMASKKTYKTAQFIVNVSISNYVGSDCIGARNPIGVDQVVDGIFVKEDDLINACLLDDYLSGKDTGIIDHLEDFLILIKKPDPNTVCNNCSQ